MKEIMLFCRAFIIIPHESSVLCDRNLWPFQTWSTIELLLRWGMYVRLICTMSLYHDEIDSITSIYFLSFCIYSSFTFLNYHSKWKSGIQAPASPWHSIHPLPKLHRAFHIILSDAWHSALCYNKIIFWISKEKRKIYYHMFCVPLKPT